MEQDNGRSPLRGSGQSGSAPSPVPGLGHSATVHNAWRPDSLHEALIYIEELEGAVRYHKGRADGWRGIAAAMGYEPNAHMNVRPTSAWIIARVAMFRERVAQGAASGIEAASADETRSGSAEGESPAPEGGDAQ